MCETIQDDFSVLFQYDDEALRRGLATLSTTELLSIATLAVVNQIRTKRIREHVYNKYLDLYTDVLCGQEPYGPHLTQRYVLKIAALNEAQITVRCDRIVRERRMRQRGRNKRRRPLSPSHGIGHGQHA